MMNRRIVHPNTIRGLFNQVVTTPLGEGRSFGRFEIKNAHQDEIVEAAVVRLPINEQTEGRRKDSNCLTPTATSSGLWVFPISELGGAKVEYAVLIAVVGVILWALGRLLDVPW